MAPDFFLCLWDFHILERFLILCWELHHKDKITMLGVQLHRVFCFTCESFKCVILFHFKQTHINKTNLTWSIQQLNTESLWMSTVEPILRRQVWIRTTGKVDTSHLRAHIWFSLGSVPWLEIYLGFISTVI